MKRPLSLLALALAGAVGVTGAPQVAAAASADEGPVTVTYEASTETIANPQRGFYHHTETHYRADDSGYTPLDGAVLEGYREEGITQILRVFYLEKFAADPVLDPEWLALVDADYDTARDAGVSVITRFAYVQGGAWPYEPPHGDAPLDVVLAHIEQLGPILRANSDVIPVVQNGFIGLWGEGYYTDHFVADPANPGVVTPEDWDARSAVTEALLAELPADRGVQARTMASKQQLLGVPASASSAVTAAEAWTDTALARVGHHNDCFLAAPDDWGTFLSDPIELDQEYLEADSLYVPVGGETCNVNPPRSEWQSASAELARYHYSYLNRDYNQDVLNSWGEDGITETAQRLGYRFVMTESTTQTQQDGSLLVTVDVRNDGWASPYTPRPASLRLLSDAGDVDVALDADSDARAWLPGTTTTLTATIAPDEVQSGSYELALALPSADAATRDDARFAVQFANVGTWDDTAGVNVLGQTVTVAADGTTAPVPPEDGSVPAAADAAATGDEPTLAATGVSSAVAPALVVAGAMVLLGGAAFASSRMRRPSAQRP
ncbi:DUF4832 domain-containing protein [Marisediminicola sp. LYQ134]|uniref:DUF4832 domain-containing protein n=1 Tax=Marisediminicola sp. LYQ134 TaxID=3391061 RepID=UPI0039837B60